MSKSQLDQSEQASNADWGLNDSRRDKRSQTRVALIMIVSLVCALGYFVYRKYDERGAGVVHAADFVQTEERETAAESTVTDGQDPVPGRPPVVDLFGSTDDGADRSDVTPFAAAQPASEYSAPVGQDEPVVDWPPAPVADPEPVMHSRDVPDQRSDFTDHPVPLQQESPLPSHTVDDAQAFDLFGPTEEQPAPQTTEPFEPVPANPDAADHQAVNPFLMTAEPETASTAPAAQPAADPFNFSQETPADPDAATSEPELPARPTLEPLTFDEIEEMPSRREQEPDVIRVNSDEQAGDVTQQAAGFDDPFFQEDSPDLESAPAVNQRQAPAMLDFGTPAGQVPAASPAPAPSNDWASQPGGIPDDVPATSSPASPFATGSTTRASDGDPFASAAISPPSATDRIDASAQVHTVQRGDSYWSISRRYYGAGRYFRALAAYNQTRIADPDDLQLGMKVLIPETGILERQYAALLSGSYVPGRRAQALPAGFFMSRDGQPMYRVGRNDTLSSIAEAHLGRASRWRQIYGMNRDQLQNADHLQLGLELRLPADASQAELVSQPVTYR